MLFRILPLFRKLHSLVVVYSEQEIVIDAVNTAATSSSFRKTESLKGVAVLFWKA